MEGDLYVCSAVEDLSEGQSSHIAPVLEGRADRRLDICLFHVRCVVVDAVGQTLLPPATCKRRILLFTATKLSASLKVSYFDALKIFLHRRRTVDFVPHHLH